MKKPIHRLAWAVSGPGLLVAWLVSAAVSAGAAATDGRDASRSGGSVYLVGVGTADITGPAGDVNMMGYAMPQQTTAGVALRLKARAFAFADATPGSKPVVVVNLDACMASQLVMLTVVERLQAALGPGVYTERNVLLTGTHTHSGPGGYLQYAFYSITSLGFVPESFEAVVSGAVAAVLMAHRAMQPGTAEIAIGELADASVNRSPSAYLRNPAEERARYDADVDTTFQLLQLRGFGGGPLGALSFFAVHGTSMNNSNKLISGDNKGLASRLLETWAAAPKPPSESESGSESESESEGVHYSPESVTNGLGSPGYVAAFAQSNVGDSSPNLQGTFCGDSAERCDEASSTCGGRNEACRGRGPGWPSDEASTLIVAQRQAAAAKRLLTRKSAAPLAGRVDFRHTYVDMTSYVSRDGVRTCKPAMGYSFAAGTTDGPGAFDFRQGATTGNAFWDAISRFIQPPSEQQATCHHPKPILLDTGEMTLPYAWQPAILPFQVLRVGQLLILAAPAELTAMAGRRLRAAAAAAAGGAFGPSLTVAIAGLSNSYSSYVTTREEYAAQRYEGASTPYGPGTLEAYLDIFSGLVRAMATGEKAPPGPSPPNLRGVQISLLPPVVRDAVPRGATFGGVARDVPEGASYGPGDTVSAVFHTGSPRNDRAPGPRGTFAAVERRTKAVGAASPSRWPWASSAAESESWVQVLDDDDWGLKFKWARPSPLSPESTATIEWAIPQGTPPGTYRLRHYGSRQAFVFFRPVQFSGASRPFEVRAR